MDHEIIETVLTEILEEIRLSNKLLGEYNQALQTNAFELSRVTNQPAAQPIKIPSIDTSKLERIIDNKLGQFSVKLDGLPRIHSFRILLFPEHGTREYYKIVFGRIIFWLVMLCIAKFAFVLGDKWITEHYQNRKYQNAWEQLYNSVDKRSQKKMQRIIDQ